MLKKDIAPYPTKESLVRYDQEQKKAAIEAVLVDGTPEYIVAAQYGVRRATIYNWKRKLLGKDGITPMKKKPDAIRPNTNIAELEAEIISKSNYFYSIHALAHDKYAELRSNLHDVFESVAGCYGYRRLHVILKRSGITVSEKAIRRLMKEEGLTVYRSYAGEISPNVANIINRNFHADMPNTKWLTDITEFSLPTGKVYLSPIIDCFDGSVVSWSIGTSPTATLANTMLDKAISLLKEGERPIIYSDRGAHYRWPGWITRTTEAGLSRSMSKKGCSPDNSACEGFFGRLKNEMFYGRSWRDVSVEDFALALDHYIRWYNSERIKESLGWMNPLECRCSLGYTG